jgi:hypothetical protein
MPLILKSATTINAAGTEVYIEFLEATGSYDADENPGGFGAPNAIRNTLAVFLYAKHKLTSGDIDADIITNNPNTVSAFTINLTKSRNGVLQHIVFALDIFDDEATYSDDDVVYDDSTDVLNPVFKEMVEGEWVVRTLDELIENENVYQVADHAFPIPDAIAFGNELNGEQLLAYAKRENGLIETDDFDVIFQRFMFVDGTIKSANTKFCREAFAQAQLAIDKVFNVQDSL